MTVILGIDVGATQLDACLLVDDCAPVLRRMPLAGKNPIDRTRSIQQATRELAYTPWDVPLAARTGHVDWITIENPKGDRIRVMVAQSRVVGAITTSAPKWCQINWHTASEWRHALGAKNTKEAGHIAVLAYGDHAWSEAVKDCNEHELDAIGIALAWRKLLAANAETAIPDEAPQTRATAGPVDTLGAEKSAPAERELPEAWQPRPQIGTA